MFFLLLLAKIGRSYVHNPNANKFIDVVDDESKKRDFSKLRNGFAKKFTGKSKVISRPSVTTGGIKDKYGDEVAKDVDRISVPVLSLAQLRNKEKNELSFVVAKDVDRISVPVLSLAQLRNKDKNELSFVVATSTERGSEKTEDFSHLRVV
ncbi:hypothetical protein GPJ56_009812 [Histomonas meleagridis]|uniref:uncharacterized protein n=1 Tax=Histomonas meleagridis TaxID=135588 RepID=UPI003559DF30|nr:hypothetical protein GPJ56_009812 [Histomonas meleagridis]KAH0802882.1 hypothetical protein GO595_004389 [Histomonas meleagridis]